MWNLHDMKEDEKEDEGSEDEVETAADEDDLFGGFLQNSCKSGIRSLFINSVFMKLTHMIFI
jgi:hypothetical protein